MKPEKLDENTCKRILASSIDHGPAAAEIVHAIVARLRGEDAAPIEHDVDLEEGHDHG